MLLRNLTPHKVTIFAADGSIIFELDPEPTQNTARVTEAIVSSHILLGLPLVVKRYSTANLPPEVDGTYLIVSKMVIDAHPERTDLVCPDTGPDSIVRDTEDRGILGVRRLQMGYREPSLTPYEQSGAVVDRIRERYGK